MSASDVKGIWFKHLCGEEREHWHEHIGGDSYFGISRCGNKRQDPGTIAAWARHVADGGVVPGQAAQCSKCVALVAKDRVRARERAQNSRRAAVTVWTNNATIAEARHGAERDACLERLEPGSPLWDSGRYEMDNRALAKAAWESGWDAAVQVMKAR